MLVLLFRLSVPKIILKNYSVPLLCCVVLNIFIKPGEITIVTRARRETHLYIIIFGAGNVYAGNCDQDKTKSYYRIFRVSSERPGH